MLTLGMPALDTWLYLLHAFGKGSSSPTLGRSHSGRKPVLNESGNQVFQGNSPCVGASPGEGEFSGMTPQVNDSAWKAVMAWLMESVRTAIFQPTRLKENRINGSHQHFHSQRKVLKALPLQHTC